MQSSSKKHLILLFIVFLLVATVPASTSFSSQNNNQQLVTPQNQCSSSLLYNPKIAAALALINEDLLGNILSTLVSVAPRFTGTYNCQQAANYMYTLLQDNGLQTRYQNWTARGNKYHPYLFTGQNIEGTIPGITNNQILFSAHYDCYQKGPGANDDGSGTAAVLAAGIALNHFTFNQTLKFVAFSGEEEGLIGSHAYVKEAYETGDNIIVDFQADMIGHATTPLGGSQMGLVTSEDVAWLLDLADELNTTYNIGLHINRGNINRDGEGGSDYFSFIEYNFEAVACWGGEHDPNMHTPQDDMTNVNLSYLVKTTRMITALLATLADQTDFSPQITIVSPRQGKQYFYGMERQNISDLKTTVIDDIWIWAKIRYSTVPIDHVEFYYDDQLEYTDTTAPYIWQFNKHSLATHRITVILYDQLGRKSTDIRDIRFINLLLKR
jgi:hypothetical protein